MNWKKDKFNLGRIPVGAKRTINFVATGDFKPVKSTYSGCGCSVPKWDEQNKTLVVEYKAQKIPKHLEGAGKTEYPASRVITVYYVNGTRDTLMFSAIVHK